MKASIPIILASIVLFVWNAISWMVFPFHSNTLINLPKEAISQEMIAGMDETGIYHYPGLPNENRSLGEIEKMLEEGPRITFMMYEAGSHSLFEPTTFLKSFGINVLTCLLLGLLFSKMKFDSMSQVLTWFTIIALIVGVTSDFSLMNWYKFPMGYTLVNVLDHIIGFLLIGMLFWKMRKMNDADYYE